MKENEFNIIKLFCFMNRKSAIEILKKANCNKHLIRHCIVVSELAVKIAKKINENGNKVDENLVEIGALLHDIGRSRTDGIKHAIEGVKIAKEFQLPKEVISIIETHIGAGLTKEDAENLGLPIKDYLPLSLEEKIVSHADNLIGGFERQKLSKAIKNLEKVNKNAVKRLKKLHEELSELAGIDLEVME